MKELPQPFMPRFVIDGTSEDGSYQGDATRGPWVVFCPNEQRNVAGPFDKRRDAIKAAKSLMERA